MTYLLALISGVLLALSFPRYGHPAFAWIALVPLLIALTGWHGRPAACRGQPPLRAFLLGLLPASSTSLGTVYWTGDRGRAPSASLPTPVAMLGDGAAGRVPGALIRRSTALVTSRLRHRAGCRRALLFAPAAWVATEFFRGVPLRRVSLGAARQQPGDGAAGGAAGQRARRLRPVGAGGVRQRRASPIALLTQRARRVMRGRRRRRRAARRRRWLGHLRGSPTDR